MTCWNPDRTLVKTAYVSGPGTWQDLRSATHARVDSRHIQSPAPSALVVHGRCRMQTMARIPLDHAATYDDLVALPDIVVAEIVDGELHASPQVIS